jgi:MFS family permease
MKHFQDTFATQTNENGEKALTPNQQSLIVSLLSVGTFFGSLMASWLADFIGRRWGLIASCGVFTVGVICQVASSAIPLFVVGRVIAGWGVGLLSAIVPLYQSESAPKWIRGTIVSIKASYDCSNTNNSTRLVHISWQLLLACY